MNIEQKIIEYCKLKNIPIKNGKVAERYCGEIREFIRQNKKDDKAYERANAYLDKIHFIIKGLIGRKEKFDPKRRMSKQDFKNVG